MTKIFKRDFNISEYTDTDVYIVCNGRTLSFDELDNIEDDQLLNINHRLYGGKGGFGSMLRAIGNQIEKTTNHEMCRDLSGRRMRDVNAEKKLREWYEKAKPEEREKAKLYLEKRRKRRELLEKGPNADYKFTNKRFMEDNEKISDSLHSSIEIALSEIVSKDSSSAGPSKQKRSKLWLEKIDNENFTTSSSSSGSEDDSPKEATASPEESEALPTASVKEPSPPPPTATEPEEVKETEEKPICKEAVLYKMQMEKRKEELEKEREKNVRSLTNEELLEVESKEKLMEFGLEVLKKSLLTRGLKCGGSLEERANRLFSVRHLSSDKYPNKHRLPPPKRTQ